MQTMLQQFKAARRVATPLLGIKTTDPGATIAHLSEALNGHAPALLEWDVVRGLRGRNDSGQHAAALVTGGDPTLDLISILDNARESLPEKSIIFAHNAHRMLDNGAFVQAVSNARDPFKSDWRQFVMLAPDLTLPAELTNDVLVLDEPLPNAEQLQTVIAEAYETAELEAPDETVLAGAVKAINGLALFPAEQAVRMSMTKQGLEIPSLWTRKVQTIEQTRGLSVWNGGETFDDLGGLSSLKQWLLDEINGRVPVSGIVFVDEGEKVMAGSSGEMTESSGVKSDQLQQFLSYMEDHQARGVILTGVPGTGKSHIAKAAGTAAGALTIGMDLGGMQGSLVGESQQNMRQAFKVVTAVTQGKALFILTCNRMNNLPPEFQSRFQSTFFLDLPTGTQNRLIWQLWMGKFDLLEQWDDAVIDSFAGWTGREIKAVCALAWRQRKTITEAARYIVPIIRSNAAQITELRAGANGRFLSANDEGVYQMMGSTAPLATTEKPRRALALED